MVGADETLKFIQQEVTPWKHQLDNPLFAAGHLRPVSYQDHTKPVETGQLDPQKLLPQTIATQEPYSTRIVTDTSPDQTDGDAPPSNETIAASVPEGDLETLARKLLAAQVRGRTEEELAEYVAQMLPALALLTASALEIFEVE